ncbi:hypothetical protein N7454_000848 [Penicillium verhagenii]|nr:hypothetical protein N7454_000848 [Penicillium verhagenii]
MELSESPFNDLDVYADWSGDPSDRVEVKIQVDIHCRPLLDKPILNTRVPKEFVKSSSLRITTSKDTLAVLDNPDLSERLQSTPGSPTMNTNSARGPIHPTSRASLSSTVIIDSPIDDFQGATIMNSPIYADLPDFHPLGHIRRSLKRNARTASLPDSVSDSDRPIGGFKHKSSFSVQLPAASPTESIQLNRPSQIPRPVSFISHSHHATSPGRISFSLTPSSNSKFTPEYLPQENIPPVKKSSENGKSNGSPLASSSNNLANYSNDAIDDSENKDGDKSEILENFSMEGTCGTPCDLHYNQHSYGPVDEYPNGPVEPHDTSQSPDSPLSPYSSKYGSSTPQIIQENGVFRIFCPRDTKPSVYRATIEFLLPLEKGTPRGWFNLVIPGLPRLQNNNAGYLYFWFPPGQGVEFRTTHLKRHNLVESCLMGQFPIFEKVVIPVRPCDARFYGFIKDFAVTQTIRADILDNKDEDPGFFVVKYHAACAIDLIQRDFWAEKCGLTIYVYGGPDADFSAHLYGTLDEVRVMHLDSSPDARIGVSEIQIICSPSNLSMFVITWKARLPRKLPMWLPRIRSSLDTEGIIDELKDRYTVAEEKDNVEIVKIPPFHATRLIRTPEPKTNIKLTRGRTVSISMISCLVAFVAVRIILRLYHNGLFMPVSFGGTDSDRDGLTVDPALDPQTDAVTLPTLIPLRDQIDYFLGWRGPF